MGAGETGWVGGTRVSHNDACVSLPTRSGTGKFPRLKEAPVAIFVSVSGRVSGGSRAGTSAGGIVWRCPLLEACAGSELTVVRSYLPTA